MRGILGAGGTLASARAGFEHRDAQVAMAEAVAGALDDGGVLLAEAGTGTGKTLAYLVPAAASARRVVVSTATRTLQSQILDKDLPLVEAALGRPIAAAVLKGRRNYLCLHRLARERARPPADSDFEQLVQLDQIARWADRTATGDRAEVAAVPEGAAIWEALTVDAESCLGRRCVRFADCFVTRARARADDAAVVVVNHHLYFADLALRESGAQILPQHDAVVFDEAHAVPDIAATFFGATISSARVEAWLRDVSRAFADGVPPEVLFALSAVAASADRLFRALRPEVAGRQPWSPQALEDPDLIGTHLTLDTALEGAMAVLTERLGEGEELAALVRRAQGLRDRLAAFFDPAEAAGRVWFREARGSGTILSFQPIEPATLLRTQLLEQLRTVVFTSATLSIGDDFDYARRRLGAGAEAVSLAWPSPFDYAHQARLYLPRDLPAPRAPSFPEAVADHAERLCALTGGRAFLLFTSYRNLQATWRLLAPRLPWPVLRQGDAPRDVLLDRFRSTPGAVLFATQSFWEGVDVAGDALSLVVIDKLPFEPPDDPVLQARAAALVEAGESPFTALQLPAAALALKQGFGRLIRTRTDRGIVAILDVRLTRQGYGRRLLAALPPAPATADFDELARWWGAVDHRGT